MRSCVSAIEGWLGWLFVRWVEWKLGRVLLGMVVEESSSVNVFCPSELVLEIAVDPCSIVMIYDGYQGGESKWAVKNEERRNHHPIKNDMKSNIHQTLIIHHRSHGPQAINQTYTEP